MGLEGRLRQSPRAPFAVLRTSCAEARPERCRFWMVGPLRAGWRPAPSPADGTGFGPDALKSLLAQTGYHSAF
jgi:hypothetical protein